MQYNEYIYNIYSGYIFNICVQHEINIDKNSCLWLYYDHA